MRCAIAVLVCSWTLLADEVRLDIHRSSSGFVELWIRAEPDTEQLVEFTGSLDGGRGWSTLTKILMGGSSNTFVLRADTVLLRQGYYRARELRRGYEGLVWIPPGTFVMGSSTSELERNSDENQHIVTLTKGFWIGKHEVTQAEYFSVIGSNQSYFRNGVAPYAGSLGVGIGGKVTNDVRHPMEQISWIDATNYCAQLTQQDRSYGKIPVEYAYRLPTEAEWEYACRAGTTNAFQFGNAFPYGNTISQTFANFDSRWGYDSGTGSDYTIYRFVFYRTVEVESYFANSFGLYDMHGNVWEWCSDWYGPYPTGAAQDPKGPTSGDYRTYRGGGWSTPGWACRAAYRGYNAQDFRRDDFGFRVVLAPVQP